MITSDGTFGVPLPADEAIAAMSDLRRMAKCLPGAELEGPDESGVYSGALVVAFGPKRIRFEGQLSSDFDVDNRCGTVSGVGVGKVRNSNVAVTAKFNVLPGNDIGNSVVNFTLIAQFGGILADLARSGGRVVLAVLLDEFSRNLKEELTSPHGIVANRMALKAHTLAWRAIRLKSKGTS
ncbi:SRPBCC domain-containing protein [Pseudochelatococcus sp. B33]